MNLSLMVKTIQPVVVLIGSDVAIAICMCVKTIGASHWLLNMADTYLAPVQATDLCM